jgi:hypothetical protein
MKGIKFTLDDKKGKRFEMVEDFTDLGVDEKFRIIYEPLYSINKNGLRTFEKTYAVYRENGERKKIGIVSADYTPVSIANEVKFVLDILKTDKDIDGIQVVSMDESIQVNILFKNNIIEFENITPYEYITGYSNLYQSRFLTNHEILKKGLTIINSYVGKVANTVSNLIQRLICTNGVVEKSLGFRIPHKIKKQLIEKRIRKILELKGNIEKIFSLPNVEKELMKPLKEKEIAIELKTLREKFKVYNIAEREYQKVLSEIELIREARDGEITVWDFANIYSALATHRIKRRITLRNQFNKKFIEFIQKHISLN